jgi:predicted transcriptional regulator
VKKFFLKLKPSAVLLLLKDNSQIWYPSKLARLSGSSFVHVVNLLEKLQKEEIVIAEKKGKKTIYKLSEKGTIIAQALDEFVKKCDQLKEKSQEKAQQQKQQ